MKRFMNWLYGISILVFFVDWCVVGLKLLEGDYDILAGLYIALVCVAVMVGYIIYRIFSSKCPYCGKLINQPRAKYCPHCGKELDK